MQHPTDSLNPERFLDEVAAVLPRSTHTEGTRLLAHARAWATIYYSGAIPEAFAFRLGTLEGQCRFLTM